MNSFVVFSCLFVASASGGFLSVPHVTTTQYHAQDELGQYSYGYSGGPSAKEETRTADGVTRGSYSYVDANGIVQSTSYVSDPIHGFRVAATNLPQAPPAVISGASVVSSAPAVIAPAPAVIARAPAVVAHAPAVVAPAPAVVAHAPSVVTHAPAFVAAAPGFDYANGVPLETPEVIAAKAAHFAAHGEALARLGRRWKRSLAAPVLAAKSFYSHAAAPASVAVAPGSTTVISGPSATGRSFSYSTVSTAPTIAVAPAVTAYSTPAAIVAPASTVVAGPAGSFVARKSFGYSAPGAVITGPVAAGRSFSYSTVATAPAIATAPASAVYTAPAAVVAPASTFAAGKSFGYSSPRGYAYSAPGVSASFVSGKSFSYSAAPASYAYSAPAIPTSYVSPPTVAAYSAPAVISAAVPVSLSSQYKVQDESGQYTYGYSDGLSSKTESRSANGVTHGGYSYLDSNGIVQSVKYVADAAGFRVHATNLPVSHH